jgi:transposase
MTISEPTLKSNELETVRRFEVFTGAGRRRDWSAAEKAQIVAESYETCGSVSEVARRHALSPQQLFAWRRAARQPDAVTASPPLFVPAMLAAADMASEVPARHQRRRRSVGASGMIELEIDGVTMRVGRGADGDTVSAIIRALKAGS